MKTLRKAPRVSIGLPVYNGEKYLREAIESVLAQTFEDFELIISDNASTDLTEKICREYTAKDQRIRYYRNEKNLGGAKNFNRIFELSSGEYFKWAAADDICMSDFLLRCVEALESSSSSVVLAYPWITVIDEKGNPLDNYSNLLGENLNSPHERFQDVMKETQCFPVFGLIKSEALKKTRLIGSICSGDKQLLAELSLLGYFLEVEEFLFYRREHQNTSYHIMKRAGNYVEQMKSNVSWYDPEKGKLFPMPHISLYLGLIKAVKRAQLSYKEKILCFEVIAQLCCKNSRKIVGDIKLFLLDYF